MNLTALSQYHNLYFVAFQNQIYVYRPRNLAQAIPGRPDAIIRPPAVIRPSALSSQKFSMLPSKPHCINSMIVGNLGVLEILLMAFDDGDVYAYYTKDIESRVRRRETDSSLSQLVELRPLLKKNLEASAWGCM